MEYQDFLQGTGTTEEIISEEAFEEFIRPTIEDRRDLFPTDEAVIAYYNNLGPRGFLDDFLSTFDDLVEGLERAKRWTGLDRIHFLKLVELAVDQI